MVTRDAWRREARECADRPSGDQRGSESGWDRWAPEQISDSHAVDIRADVYSLGCTLYKLLTGDPPFVGPEYESDFDKMTAHVQKPVPPIHERRSDLPQDLAMVVDWMLAKDPAERFATPQEVADALAPLCTGGDLPSLPQEAQRPSPWAAEIEGSAVATDEERSVPLMDTESSHRRKPGPPPLRTRLGWRRLGVAVSLGVLLLGGVLAVTFGRRWIDSTGKYTTQAEFAGLKNGMVRLKKEDGSVVVIPRERLSEADQKVVQELTWPVKVAEPIPPPTPLALNISAEEREFSVGEALSGSASCRPERWLAPASGAGSEARAPAWSPSDG